MKTKKRFTCGDCIYCDQEQMDDKEFAPCLVNPPVLVFDKEIQQWRSGRPFTKITSVACQFGKQIK